MSVTEYGILRECTQLSLKAEPKRWIRQGRKYRPSVLNARGPQMVSPTGKRTSNKVGSQGFGKRRRGIKEDSYYGLTAPETAIVTEPSSIIVGARHALFDCRHRRGEKKTYIGYGIQRFNFASGNARWGFEGHPWNPSVWQVKTSTSNVDIPWCLC
jgi:hypothetical protein